MTTLIAVYNSDGCVGRCDERCYNAVGPDCECICGGRNHGKGLQPALQNVREMAGVMVNEYAGRHSLELTAVKSDFTAEGELGVPADFQPNLFSLLAADEQPAVVAPAPRPAPKGGDDEGKVH